ncbi:TPA: 4Fe-4S dicluster domain-containing protein [Candidatus Bathyarchaeota archaeon]|nr:4Fe-4S dicluster domain-containing protein [Candidatus Bathyarchaeota archaeon]
MCNMITLLYKDYRLSNPFQIGLVGQWKDLLFTSRYNIVIKNGDHMTSKEINYEDLKKGGYIVQRNPEYFTIRLRVPGGNLSAEQLKTLAEIAEKYGRGQIHLTTRQGVQIPYVKYENLGEITEELKKIGTPPGSCGPRVRNISSCVGAPECPQALINTYELTRKIDERYFGRDLPTKIKIGITGCPNSCAKPQLNDIGIMGVVKPKIITEKCNGCGLCMETCKEGAIKIIDGKAVIDHNRCVYCGECIRVCPVDADVAEKRGYSIFIGGNVGRHPRLAQKIIGFADEETIFKVIENSLKVFKEEAVQNERFGHLIERIGLGEFLKRVLA